MSFAFVPLVIKYLGIEAYGLIGFYISLTILGSALDMGLSTTLNREIARLTAGPDGVTAARDLLRTLEWLYWAAGLGVGIAVIALAPWLSHSWVNAKGLSVETVGRAIVLQGIALAFRWPIPLYFGGLMGLQRQVIANVLNAAFATAQGAGGLFVVACLSPTIEAYFIWQIVIGGLQSAAYSRALWRAVPQPGHRPGFSRGSLAAVWRFAAGMSVITIGAIALGQVDKIFLSRLVPLESFGYYSVAGLVATGVSFPAMAIYGAAFPLFAQLVATERWDLLTTSYHRSCQWLSLALFPPSLALAFFPREVLEIYVPHSAVASHAAELLRVIVIGHMLSSVLVMPLALQLAYGWTRLALFKYVIGVPLFVGALVLLVPRYGALGAALAWVGVNVGFIACEIPLMHHRLLRGEMSRWYLADVAVPAGVATAILGLSRWVMPVERGALFNLSWLAGSTGLAFVVLVALLPATRPVLNRLLAR